MDPPTKEQSDKLSTEPQTGDLGQPSDEQASAQKGIYLNISIRKHQKCVTTYDTYAVFHVTTDTNRTEYPGTHLAVDRRYSEFEWLQSRLIHTHPSLFVPPLPGKMLTTALDRFNENFLSARAAGLQLFLARIGRHPILSHDADFIAFLSLSKEELAKYRTSHQSSSILSNWLAETRLNFMPKPKSGMSYDSGNPRKSQEAALGLIGSSAMHQYEAEFKNYSEETNSFLSLAQCVARATDQIVTNLEGLGNGFNELAHCLATWPLQLNVQVDNETFTDRNALDNRLKSGGRVSQVGLDWNRERPVGPELAGKGATRAAREVAELASELRTDALANWKGAAAYAQSIKSVLGSRETLEKRYFELVNALKEETGESNPGLMDGTLTVIARSYLPWRQKGLPELVADANQLQDSLTFSNGQIRAEFHRWRSERQRETMTNLIKMSEAYVTHWTNISEGWREVATELEKCAPKEECGTSEPEDQEPLAELPDFTSTAASVERVPNFGANEENEAFLLSSDGSADFNEAELH